MTAHVLVASTGARTPVGMGSAASAAACRAAVSAVRKHPFLVDQAGDMMPVALDTALNPSLAGPARLMALAEAALREACAVLDNPAQPRWQLPVFLALPEPRPGFDEHDAQTVQEGLAAIDDLPIHISQVHVLAQGHACGLAALGIARDRIQQGVFEACLVGGVDSYFHADTMEWLDTNKQLSGSVSRSSFVPGEGAAFCLLMSDAACKRAGLVGLARLGAVSLAHETKLIKTADVSLGAGLTSAVKNAVAFDKLPSQTICDIICDINGERYRGEEWGFVCLRLSAHFDDPTGYRAPADCWGDVGAASGPLFVMLACEAAARGYSKGPRTLLWASSERGLRAAAVLEFPEAAAMQWGDQRV